MWTLRLLRACDKSSSDYLCHEQNLHLSRGTVVLSLGCFLSGEA
ncbi:hypothetical protein APHNP_1131 [Anaplasma phagocytophilum str. ApNP]|uniref:Uncharacterized protein n=1 Tax=Anaplasma phagocytophilum str. ApNP TaxID=1359153 RepID=A0A0F3NIL6_ANAPH|nr:hypothetical protein APHNP_1131 [Anaplasma phagocytophilum str. ApNP]